MTASIVVANHGDELVAVKRRADHADLAHEARYLARIDHPGVVQLVRLDDGPPAQLLTRFIGPDGWGTGPGEPIEAVRGLARISAIVADLHDAGIAHRALRAEHVIVANDGRPVLCSFTAAGAADAISLQDDHTDLAALLRATGCGEWQAPVDAIADSLANGRFNARTATVQLDAVLASSPTTPAPPTKRHLDLGRLPTLQPTRRHAVAAAATVAALTIGAAIAALGGADPAPAAEPSHATSAPTTSINAQAPGEDSIAAPPVPATGAVFEHLGRRYAVGAPGDVVVVADWDCRGLATPAVLRPSDGTVAVFKSWPEPHSTARANHVETVDGAQSLSVDESGPCPRVRVHTANSSHLIRSEQT